MAKVIGAAGRYTTEQSIRVFQRMLITTMLLLVAIGVFEGAVISSLFIGGRSFSISVLAAALLGALIIWHLCKAQHRRIDRLERERSNWRSGAEGERAVAAVLDQLPKAFVVFHDFNTVRGNFDHLVIGPTGIFAIETKNWRGKIEADAGGELLRDGKPASRPYVKQLLARVMAVREQAMVLSGREMFIQGVMVFPKASVGASFGTTQCIHCVRDAKLCSYVENEKFAKKLMPDEIELFTRAFKGIAGMDVDFRSAA
jgi:hypothetical protein